MNTEDKPIIIIGEAYDGFSLTVDDFPVWISQEELPTNNPVVEIFTLAPTLINVVLAVVVFNPPERFAKPAADN